jgi:hypothetical protein
MSDDYHTDKRLQLLALGYVILPNKDKRCVLKGWSDADYVRRELSSSGKGSGVDKVTRWPERFPEFRATGVRLENRQGVIDADVDDGPMVEQTWVDLARIAPEVVERAPTRFGGAEHKVALFVRIEGETFARIASAKYFRPGEDPATANGHRIEIFGGGGGAKQFGVYGPHSYNDDGTIKREYVWSPDAPELAAIETGAQPPFTAKQAHALVDAFERAARAAGWTACPTEAAGDEGEKVYDIDEGTRFDTNRAGDGLTYAELCDAQAAFGELRCAATFMPGRGDSGSRERCSVYYSRQHDCVAVHVWGEGTHFPRELAPVDPEAFAERLKEVAAAQGFPVSTMVTPNWRERYENGSPKASLHNAILAIEACGVVGVEDVFHGRMMLGRGEAGGAGPVPPYCGVVTDGTVRALRIHLSNRFGRDFTETHVRDAVLTICGAHPFNPVTDMLADAEANWDGVERLDRMAVDHFNCADTPLARACVRKTMIAAVARARRPGCKFDTIPVLEAPEGWNKSTAWAVLAGEGNFSDEKIMGAASKDVQEQLAGVWIHENGEMAGMKKAEVEMVKAFASRQVDRARPAYGRFLVEQPRHSIEVGTTNVSMYLPSASGNRRFWPLAVLAPIDIGRLRATRLQLWGEAAARDTAGESLVLDEALWAEAAIEQEARRVPHPWEATLAKLSRIPEGGAIGGVDAFSTMIVTRVGDEDRVSTRDIFNRALELKGWQMHRGHSTELAAVMRLYGWTNKQTRVDGTSVAGYVRPATWGAKKVSE